MSKIAETTTAVILTVFAGQTATHNEISEQIEMQYAMANKKTAFGSYVQILNALDANGVTVKHTADFNHLYTFPAA